MKNGAKMKNKILGLVITGITLCSPLSSFAFSKDGHGTGNGGDLYAQEYYGIAKNLYDVGCVKTNLLSSHISCNLFLEKLKTVKVTTEKFVYGPDQKQRDAINFPEKNAIIVGRYNWQSILSKEAKVSNVVHEFSALMLLEGSDEYKISHLIIQTLLDAKISFADLVPEQLIDLKKLNLFNSGKLDIHCESNSKDSFGTMIPIYMNHLATSYTIDSVGKTGIFLDDTNSRQYHPHIVFQGNPKISLNYKYNIEDGVTYLYGYGKTINKRHGAVSLKSAFDKIIEIRGTSENNFEVVVTIRALRSAREAFEDFEQLNVLGDLVEAGSASNKDGKISIRLKKCSL